MEAPPVPRSIGGSLSSLSEMSHLSSSRDDFAKTNATKRAQYGVFQASESSSRGLSKLAVIGVAAVLLLLNLLKGFGSSPGSGDLRASNDVVSEISALRRESKELRAQFDSIHQQFTDLKGVSKLTSNYEALEKGLSSFAAASTERQLAFEHKLDTFEKFIHDRNIATKSLFDELTIEMKKAVGSAYEGFVQEALNFERSVETNRKERNSDIRSLAADISFLSTELRHLKQQSPQSAHVETEPVYMRNHASGSRIVNDQYMRDAAMESMEAPQPASWPILRSDRLRQEIPPLQRYQHAQGSVPSTQQPLMTEVPSSHPNERSKIFKVSEQSAGSDWLAKLQDAFVKFKSKSDDMSKKQEPSTVKHSETIQNVTEDETKRESFWNKMWSSAIGKGWNRPHPDQANANLPRGLKLSGADRSSKAVETQSKHSTSDKSSGSRFTDGFRLRWLSDNADHVAEKVEPTVWTESGFLDNTTLWLLKFAHVTNFLDCGDCGHLLTHHAVISRLSPLALAERHSRTSTAVAGQPAPVSFPSGPSALQEPASRIPIRSGVSKPQMNAFHKSIVVEPQPPAPAPNKASIPQPLIATNITVAQPQLEVQQTSVPSIQIPIVPETAPSPPTITKTAIPRLPDVALVPIMESNKGSEMRQRKTMEPPKVNFEDTDEISKHQKPNKAVFETNTSISASVNQMKPPHPEQFPSILAFYVTNWCISAAFCVWMGWKTGFPGQYMLKGPTCDTYDWICIWACVFGMVYALISYWTAKLPEKRFLSLALFLCLGMAIGSYIIMIFRLDPAIVDPFRGTLNHPIRFIEWMCCCPLLIQIIFVITKTRRNVSYVRLANFLMDLTGFFGAIFPRPWADISLVVSQGLFMYIIINLWIVYTDAIDGKTECRFPTRSLKIVRVTTMIAWWTFTTTYLIYCGGILTHDQFEAGMIGADIFAKVILVTIETSLMFCSSVVDKSLFRYYSVAKTLILTNASIEQVQTFAVEKVEQVNNTLNALVEELDAEVAETDAILARLIPEDVIQQIKSGQDTGAREFEAVTVFFSDIASFTVLSSRTEPKDMIKMLERLWQQYDAIARKWGIYKIETIGDAFFGVAGCPTETPDHAERAVQFSLDIMAMIKDFRTEAGPVTAGILGETNPHYTVVGDTATVASRMEATSKPGRIHINETTYSMVKDLGKFRFSGPEPIEIKGVTTLAYFVDDRI
ncbi:hypothetical protein HDU93_010086 [Gonapodya sp. JEL0774]|nr:hypothetical protein HDU93_010086 [Gonapodya sp. JEL0774]